MARYIIDNRPEEIGFETSNNLLSRTIQNCKNLLMTQMGEVPYDRLRGFDPALYHLPMEKMRLALLPELDRVMAWEPDAEVAEAKAEMLENGEALITVTLEIGVR